MFNKKLMAVVVLLAVAFSVPSWGAQFKRKGISDAQFFGMCQGGNTQGVIEAIKSGANVNARGGDYGEPALMVAVRGGYTEMVNALIQAGADVNATRRNNGNTALMVAVGGGHTEIVKALIKAGANVNAKNKDGETALMWAAEEGYTEIANALIKAGAVVKNDESFVLLGAAEKGHTETVNALIQAGADLNVKDVVGRTALMLAANNGHTETVNALIEGGAEDLTDRSGRTALIHATSRYDKDGHPSRSNPETVNALIDAGSYVKHRDYSGKTALDYARENPKLKGTDVLKRLEDPSNYRMPVQNSSSNKVSDQQFIDMCQEGNTQGVIEAIKSGANVNAKDNGDYTALRWAAVLGHTEMVNALIQAGADVNAKDNYGMTALMEARNAEIVKALIQAGADVNAKTNNGGTALMFAALCGNTETVNALINARADDLTDNNGQTALIHAAKFEYSNAETVNALIDAGSYVKHRDNSGKMALDYARENPIFKGTDALKRLEELSR